MTPTRCKNGHPWTEENRYQTPNGSYCKVCNRERKRKPRKPFPATAIWFDVSAA